MAADVRCLSCHGAENTELAPTLRGLWGTDALLDDGRSVTVDEAYVRRAITDPAEDVVSGHGTAMPICGLTDYEVDQLVDYVRGLG